MKKILLIIFLLPAIAGNAQVKNLRAYNISFENGSTPIGGINAMLQDKYGYIWIAGVTQLVRYDGYHTKVYLSELGLSWLAGAQTIFQDKEGVLWVGTIHHGLFRYDRAADTFKQIIYSPIDSTASNNIISIHEDSSENIWALSEDRSGKNELVNCYNKKTGKWRHFGKTDTGNFHIDANVSDLYVDHEGHIWLGSENGIYEYDSAANRFVGYLTSKDPAQEKICFSLCEASSYPGILWIGIRSNKTMWNGISRFNIHDHSFTTFRHKNGDAGSIGTDSVLSIKEDKEGRLWIITMDGLSTFNPKTGIFSNYPIPGKREHWFDHGIGNFKEDRRGNFWCITPGGLIYFNTKTKAFTRYTVNANDPGPQQNTYYSRLMIDNTGTLWLASENRVLWINKEGSRFTVYRNTEGAEKGYPGGSVNSFAEAADGSFWLGTNKGLVHWNRAANSFIPVKLNASGFQNPNALTPNEIDAVTIDHNGILWCGGASGLFRYAPTTGNIIHYTYSKTDATTLSSNVVPLIYEGREGTLWIGTAFGGLCSLNPETGKFTRYPYTGDNNDAIKPGNKKLIGTDVNAIYEDRQGTIWVGTNGSSSGGGLNRFNRNDSTFTFFCNITRGLTNVQNIREDKNGLLWIGTWDGGIFHFNPKTDSIQQQFTQKDGLLINTIHKNLQDNQGKFWLISPEGMTIFNPVTGSAHRLTTANGLPSVKFGYNGAFETREGDFLIGTSTGFIEFNPDQFTPDPNPPLVHIENIAFTKPQQRNNSSEDSTLIVFGHNKFNFRYNENRITFSYVGIHYQNAAMTQYEYKLEGYDKNWIQAGTERSVTYTNLSPGTYTFHVKAANSDGVWSKEDSFTITIHPPFWETWWAYLIYTLTGIGIIWGIISYRSGNLKRKNQFLEEKVSKRTNELQQSLENLKSTQKQLIQSEKMASLGELTAGIAHEIQNPLNFVNNFSEVNKELIDEAGGEIDKGNIQEVKIILNDIKENSEKINHHGKRADAIVKGMLQHSKKSTGQKELTDINALADEYLRLSYHGMRAKDKSFNAEMKTDFDEAIGKINIIPQDIGRVLLNLFNNAFYACAERSRSAENKRLRQAQPDIHYEPTVTVKTFRNTSLEPARPLGGSREAITITVTDNGNGIPQNIVDKIFQPFFTTKPTGEGTGLGLSLSYDIVKAHGGELKVVTNEGEGSEFIIQLPVT